MKDWTDVTRQDAVLRGSEKFHYKPTAGKSSPNNKHAGDFGMSDPRKRWIQQVRQRTEAVHRQSRDGAQSRTTSARDK